MSHHDKRNDINNNSNKSKQKNLLNLIAKMKWREKRDEMEL